MILIYLIRFFLFVFSIVRRLFVHLDLRSYISIFNTEEAGEHIYSSLLFPLVLHLASITAPTHRVADVQNEVHISSGVYF